MSKNVVIQRNGVSETWEDIEVIRTQAVGGGTEEWVPEDETQAGALTVTENGTYKASDRGLYAFDSVVALVSGGSGQIVAHDPDGNDYSYGKDGSGNIVKTKLPSEIRVTTLPNVTTYGVGAYLGFDGIEVTKYDGNGESMGTVPFEELIFPVTQAPWEPIGGVYGEIETSENENLQQFLPIRICNSYSAESDAVYKYFKAKMSNGKLIVFAERRQGELSFLTIAASSSPGATYGTMISPTEYEPTEDIPVDDTPYVRDGKPVYSRRTQSSLSGEIVHADPYNSGYPIEYEKRIAWEAIYGNIATKGGFQVPVQWQRPADGMTLETSFGITVVAGPSGDDDN